MTPTTTRGAARRLAAGATLLVALLAGGRAEAQWGYGGFGLNPFGLSQTMENGINQRAALAGSAAFAARGGGGGGGGSAYAGNPNAYINHLRGATFTDRYDVSSRGGYESRVARTAAPARPAATTAAAPATPVSPVIPLLSFFDAMNRLVWPADAPTEGDLKPKRDRSDLASLAVLNDSRLNGLASVGTVTDARTKLLDYGRPALQFMRERTTTRVSDGFHLFLMSLYESLAQAATTPNENAAKTR